MTGFLTVTGILWFTIGFSVGGWVAYKGRQRGNRLEAVEIFVSSVLWPVTLAYIWIVRQGKSNGK